MSYSEKLREKVNSVQVAYDEAMKALEGMRLQATMYDAAQALMDVQRPGEKVVEILLSTDSATPLTEIYNRAEAKLAEAENYLTQAKDIASKAEAMLEDAKKQPAKKTVYVVMFGAVNRKNELYQTWVSRDTPGQFETLGLAVKAVTDKGHTLQAKSGLLYYIVEKQVDA